MKSLYITIVIALLVQTPSFAGQQVSQGDIQEAVQSFVLSQIQADLEPEMRAEVRVRWQGHVELEGVGEVNIRVRRASSRPLSGPCVVRVGIDVDGQTLRTMSVTADVRFFRPVLVASHMLRRGEELDETSCELAERDVTQLRNGYFVSAAEVISSMQLRRVLSAGDIITKRHVEKIPVVKRGDAITLVARAGRLSMSAAGEALQNGGIGDRIRVKNSDSGKIIYGQVLDGGLIQVGL